MEGWYDPFLHIAAIPLGDILWLPLQIVLCVAKSWRVTDQPTLGRQSSGDERRREERERLQGGNHLKVGAVEDRELRALHLSPLRRFQDRHLELVRFLPRPLSFAFSIQHPLFLTFMLGIQVLIRREESVRSHPVIPGAIPRLQGAATRRQIRSPCLQPCSWSPPLYLPWYSHLSRGSLIALSFGLRSLDFLV